MGDFGWIKLHRELLNKPIWKQSTPVQQSILITLLLMANHDEEELFINGKKTIIKPGQMFTSLPNIAQKANRGVTTQNVRTALARFEKLEFLTNQSTAQGRLITIVNWGVYQGLKDKPNRASNRHLTDHQQTPNRHLTDDLTPNNNKDNNNNVNKEDKKTYGDFFERIWSLYPVKKGKGSVSDTQKRKLYAIGYDELKRAIERYSAENANTDLKYWKHGSTFFNSGYVDYLDANYQPVQKMHQQPDCPPKYEKWERMQDYVQKQDPTVKRIPIPRPDATLQERVNYENRVEFLYDQALKTQKREEKQNGL